MAIAYDQTINLRIAAETTGANEVDKLANEIEALGKQGATAAPRFLELANEVRNLGQQQVRITGLESAIASAKQTWTAVSDARREVQALDKALADAKGAGANRDAIKLLEGALRTANRELASSEKAWVRQKDVLNSTRQAAADAGVDTKALASEQARLAVALDGASQALTEQKVALSAQQAAAKSQAAEEDRLAQIVETSKTRQKLAAQELLAVEKKVYAEAEAAASRAATQRAAEAKAVEDFSTRTKKALADAFSGAGVRSAAAIQSDILQVNQSLLKLASNAKVSGADFDRAFTAGQARIATLRAEMDGTGAASAKLEASTKTLAGEFKGLVAQLGGVYVAFQAGGMFVAANSQAETFARTMTQLTGSSQKAAAEMEYVRSAANRLGLDVQDAAKAYTQLIAATKGTTLEGEGARRVFESISGAMASLGKSSAETTDAMRAVNQMASKGTVAMEELKGQLGEALPGAMKAAANGAGLTVAELSKMVETGGVLAEDLLPALAKGLTDMYGVGKSNNDTFVAQWARMKNSVTEFFQAVGDTGVMKALNEGIALTTFGVKALTVGFDTVVGKTKELFGGPQWDSEKARLSLEAVARNSALLSKSLDDVATAGTRMGTVLREQSNSALQLQNAFSKANTDLDKQLVNLEKLAGARKAEATAAAQISGLYDTEAQQRRSAVTAAEAQEAAMRRIAEQSQFAVALKETELAKEKMLGSERQKQVAADISNTTAMIERLEAEAAARGSTSKAIENQIAQQEIYLRALKDERAGMGGESEARKTKIEALEKEIEAKKAQQEAVASHSATLATKAAAETYADNSKRVNELRAAHEAAAAAFEKTGEAFVKGVATDKELTASREAAQRALLLYRDALNDATAAAERHVTAERTSASLQQSALQNDLYRANTILEIAKQRGNEKEIAQAQIAVWRIELEISEAQAQASRLEAEAMLIVAKAKRAELEASGALSEAKKAELAVMDANIKAKQLEADKYDLIAARMKALSYETKELKSSFFDLSSSTDDAASAADRAATSYDGLTTSIRGAAAAKDGFTRDASGNVLEVASVTPQTVATRLKNLGVSETVATQQSTQFFDAAGNTQNTYGLSLDAAVQALADRLTGKGVQSSSMNIVRVDLTTNRGTSSVKVASQADAAALVSTLQELAARS